MHSTYTMVMSSVIGCLLTVPTQAQNGSTEPEFIRYDFTISVRENLFGSSVNSLAGLQVGQLGSFSITVLNDRDLFGSQSTETDQVYSIQDIAIQIGSINSGGDPAHVPSVGFLDTFLLSNNGRASSHPQAAVSDSMGSILYFDNPDLGFSVFSISQVTTFDVEPTLFSSLDLPREPFDLSLITSQNHLVIQDPADGFQRVNFVFTNVEITVIPTPATGVLAILSGICARNRRRR